jgi:hypothetical protein
MSIIVEIIGEEAPSRTRRGHKQEGFRGSEDLLEHCRVVFVLGKQDWHGHVLDFSVHPSGIACLPMLAPNSADQSSSPS